MQGLTIIAKEIEEKISTDLTRCGLLFRIFYRVKSTESTRKKIENKRNEYVAENKKMQDIIGLRITLYFSDDVGVLYNFLKHKKDYVDESKDIIEVDKFCPQRLNLIMRISHDRKKDFLDIISDFHTENLIDDTYEIQIRTVLSEGWHEVEHDLRYKCKDEWNEFPDYSRTLNGIYATLETGEWSMLSLFHKLAHENYKKQKWVSMMRNKMRLRFIDDSFSPEILEFLTSTPIISKKILRSNREDILHKILDENFRLPVKYDTILHLLNRIDLNSEQLRSLESDVLRKELDIFFSVVS